jgi:cyclopropane-fatty-acyl-phospholipid synthase
MKTALRLLERGWVPDALTRRGIRALLRERLREQEVRYAVGREEVLREWSNEMRSSPIALVPKTANEQHYELPPDFFRAVLGPRLKYSSCFYADERTTLAEAEVSMLALTCERAALADGLEILELGCGWGSLTLWMAAAYPRSRIVAVSNSAPQRLFIEQRARAAGLTNVEVQTCDMNAFDTGRRFDRVVSVEMFEHMRNWEALLRRAHSWLRTDGRLFLHVFAHKSYAYPFEVRDESDWMSQHFFTGGMMPCPDLIDHLDVPFDVEERWIVPGTHYARTAEGWLANLDRSRAALRTTLASVYGAENAGMWHERWRAFFLACAESFAYRDGNEWLVTHVRLAGRPR